MPLMLGKKPHCNLGSMVGRGQTATSEVFASACASSEFARGTTTSTGKVDCKHQLLSQQVLSLQSDIHPSSSISSSQERPRAWSCSLEDECLPGLKVFFGIVLRRRTWIAKCGQLVLSVPVHVPLAMSRLTHDVPK